MGYTNYWKFVKNGNAIAPQDIENGKHKFKDSVALFKECLNALNGKVKYPNWGEDAFSKEVDLVLCNGAGEGEPIITDTDIVFNGSRERGEEYETFSIHINDGEWDFCKTAREPYDIAVQLCLLSFKYYFGENFEFSSDGGEKEWAFANEVFSTLVD